MMNVMRDFGENDKIMYMVTISHNDFAKEFYVFDSLEEAVPYYKSRLEELFKEAHADADDNGTSLDDCVIFGECLLDDKYHGIDIINHKNGKGE